ncbi:MAG: aminotransferase class I/II-fold pyridoxal phosphate-dependent enzyme, partial [Omnitrophica bacterium]|nr:aminotransferase class I/II-fold pyridoxal phosphate-dependent enzyme [Candidatus Omnitrophota bacterium]
VACAERIVNYFINTSRSFIYSTALSPAVIAASLASLDLIAQEPFRRKGLLENAQYLREELKKEGFEIRGSSQVVPLILKEPEKAVDLSGKLQELGYWVLPIRPPTVPADEARLRFSLSYAHSRESLKKLINDIVISI